MSNIVAEMRTCIVSYAMPERDLQVIVMQENGGHGRHIDDPRPLDSIARYKVVFKSICDTMRLIGVIRENVDITLIRRVIEFDMQAHIGPS